MQVVVKYSFDAFTTINPAEVDNELSIHRMIDRVQDSKMYTDQDLNSIYSRKHNFVCLLFVSSEDDVMQAHKAAKKNGENKCVFLVWADEEKKITVPKQSKVSVVNWSDFKKQKGQATLATFQSLDLKAK